MKLINRFLLLANVLFAAYGLYIEFAPKGSLLVLKELQPGMGLLMASIGASMAIVSATLESERGERESDRDERRKAGDADRMLLNVLSRVSAAVPVHEREFYALWPEQMKRASENIDVTHLGIRAPRSRHGHAEDEYFENMKRICETSQANIRRVERLTLEKRDWIRRLLKNFVGVENFSLTLYKDPLTDEMPAALSVSRIDRKYAWLVAVAEHESTGPVRDILFTGEEAVGLMTNYFQNRLWNRGTLVIDHGEITKDGENWESLL